VVFTDGNKETAVRLRAVPTPALGCYFINCAARHLALVYVKDEQ